MKKYFSFIFLILSLTLFFVGCGSKTEQPEIEYTPEEIEIMEQGYTLIKGDPDGAREYAKKINGIITHDSVYVAFYGGDIHIRYSTYKLSDEDIENLQEIYKDFQVPKDKLDNYVFVYQKDAWRLVERKKRIRWHPVVHYFYKETYWQDVLTKEVYEDEHAGEIK